MRDPSVFKDALVFTGGGTGGHYFPAVALAEGARERWPARPIVFVGATRGIEAKRLPDSGWPFLLFDVEGFSGRSPASILRAAWKLMRARHSLLSEWKTCRPRAVVATGGYGAGPAVLAARALGIPYFLHESNAEPGILVRHLAKDARRVWCGMEVVRHRLPQAECLLAGTPVRTAFLRAFTSCSALSAPYRVLVLGGSGGARALNEAVLRLAPALLERFPEWSILHQTGARDFAEMELRPRHPRHALTAFLETVDRDMEAASLVVGRSGASTCAELKAVGRPAILVPMPGSAGDHQTMNAKAMAAENRAVHLQQSSTLEEALAAEMARLMASPALRAGFAPAEPNRAVVSCLDDLAPCLA